MVGREVEMDAMVEGLVESEDKPLTNNPDAVGELLRCGTQLWTLLL